jgi:hypothetical protein
LIHFPVSGGSDVALIFRGISALRSQVLGDLVNAHGMLVRPFAELVSRQAISFTMGDGSDCMRVGGNIMEFSSSLMFTL